MENLLFDLLGDRTMCVVASEVERVNDVPVCNFGGVNLELFVDASHMQMRHANDLVGPIHQLLSKRLGDMLLTIVTHFGHDSTHFWCHA